MANAHNEITALDAQVGGDGDIDGIAQTLTADDVLAVLSGPQPLGERKAQLLAMRFDIEARASADRGGEFAELLDQIEDAIATLDGDGDESASRATLGMDESDRSDIRPLDEREV